MTMSTNFIIAKMIVQSNLDKITNFYVTNCVILSRFNCISISYIVHCERCIYLQLIIINSNYSAHQAKLLGSKIVNIKMYEQSP